MNVLMLNVIFLSLLLTGGTSFANSIDEILQTYRQDALKQDPKFAGFSAERGKTLYFRKGTGDKSNHSCATCHTSDPTQIGRTRANKDIAPMAPSINKKRFTDMKHVEKWFTRNCDDVFSIPCTSKEKGDFIVFLRTFK